MSKKCTAKIYLQSQPEEILVDLGQFKEDNVNNAYKLDSIYKTISEDATIQDLLKSTAAINRPNKYEIKGIDDSTNFPISNTTVGEVANMCGGKLATLYNSIMGDIPEQNLLLVNSKFTYDGFATAGIYEKQIDGVTRRLTILNGNINNITNYLTYHYIIAKQLNNKDLRAIYSNLKGVDEYKGTDSDADFKEFLKYYFFDTKARTFIDRALRKDGVNVFDEAITHLINEDISYPSLNNPDIEKFVKKIKESGYVSRKDLNAFENQYSMQSDIDAIRFLNYRGANLVTIYNDENVYVFEKEEPIKLNTPNNSVYINNIINDWIDYKDGYKIYKVSKDNKLMYFITNVELNDAKNANKILFDTADEAIADFEKRNRSKLLKDCKLSVKPRDKITCRLYEFPTRAYNNWVFDKDWTNKAYSDMYKNYKVRYRELFEQHPDWLDAITIPNNLLILLSIKSKLSEEYMKSKPDNIVPNIRRSDIIQEDTRETETAFNELMNIKVQSYTINTKGEFEEGNPSNFTHFDRNEIFDNNRDQVNDLFTLINSLQNSLGVKINATNSYSAKIMVGTSTAKAFVYNGEIYVNIDRATNADVIHEYGHIILGTIKQCDSGLYKALIDSVTRSDNFSKEFMKVKSSQSYVNRAYQDLLEEVYCNMFGEFISGDLTNFKKIIRAMFGLCSPNISNSDLNEIAGMSFGDLIERYGSTIFDPQKFNLKESYKSRKDANIIEKAIQSGLVTEKCK